MNDSRLSGAAPGQATEVRCRHCQDRVLFIAAERGKALEAMAMHLVTQHRNLSVVLLEGTDLLVGPAPYRCDLCLSIAEPPWWTYLTPSTDVFYAEDPGWLVCETCHQVIASHDEPLAVLTERSLSVQTAEFILEPIPVPELRASIKETVQGFLDHRQGEPVRSD